MATLSDAHRQAIHEAVMTDLGQSNTTIPIDSDDLRALVNFMDGQLETAESTIFAALPAGDGKTWILANQALGRELLTRIERVRREVL